LVEDHGRRTYALQKLCLPREFDAARVVRVFASSAIDFRRGCYRSSGGNDRRGWGWRGRRRSLWDYDRWQRRRRWRPEAFIARHLRRAKLFARRRVDRRLPLSARQEEIEDHAHAHDRRDDRDRPHHADARTSDLSADGGIVVDRLVAGI
jgi:hypothetical protein